MKRQRCVSGFSLLEVLVTVVILSLGMLGVAGVLLLVHKNNASSYMEQQAVQQAYDILDRMRANRSAAINGDYDQTPPTSVPSPSCAGSTCTPKQMALYDLWQWNSDLTANLPAASGSIATTVPAGVSSANQNTQVTVRISWSDAPTQQALKQTVARASYTLQTVL